MATRTAEFHRMHWDYQKQCGLAKIHYEDIGVFALAFEEGCKPIAAVEPTDNELKMWCDRLKRVGASLVNGFNVSRDKEIVLVKEQNGIFLFSGINLEMGLSSSSAIVTTGHYPGDNSYQFRVRGSDIWQDFDAPVYEYAPCRSLTGLTMR